MWTFIEQRARRNTQQNNPAAQARKLIHDFLASEAVCRLLSPYLPANVAFPRSNDKKVIMSALQATSHAVSKIAELVDRQSEKSISIIMPTYKEGWQLKQTAIRLKNLLSQVARKLEAMARNGSI